MDPHLGSRAVPSDLRSAESTSRRATGERPGATMSRSKRRAAAAVMTASALLAGPASSVAASASAPAGVMAPAPGVAEARAAERALAARLATEYAGAVPAQDIESLVRSVSRDLGGNAKLADRLPYAIEAACRRALTDFLAVGVPLPAG